MRISNQKCGHLLKRKVLKPPCPLSQKLFCKARPMVSVDRCAERCEIIMVGKERKSIMLIVFCAQLQNVSHFGCII